MGIGRARARSVRTLRGWRLEQGDKHRAETSGTWNEDIERGLKKHLFLLASPALDFDLPLSGSRLVGVCLRKAKRHGVPQLCPRRPIAGIVFGNTGPDVIADADVVGAIGSFEDVGEPDHPLSC